MVPIVLGAANSFCVIVCINNPAILIELPANITLNSLGTRDNQNTCCILSSCWMNSPQENVCAPTDKDINDRMSKRMLKCLNFIISPS